MEAPGIKNGLTEQELRRKIAELQQEVEEELLYPIEEKEDTDDSGRKNKRHEPTRSAAAELAHYQGLLNHMLRTR